MKKILPIMVAILMVVSFALAPLVNAANNEDVTVTITPTGETVTIDVNGTTPSYGLGEVSLGSSGETTATYFTVYNNGTVDVSIDADPSVTTGSNPWTYVVWADYDAKDETTMNITIDTWDGAGDNNLAVDGTQIIADLAISGSETFGIKVWVPSSVSVTTEQTLKANIAGTAL